MVDYGVRYKKVRNRGKFDDSLNSNVITSGNTFTGLNSDIILVLLETLLPTVLGLLPAVI